MLTTFAVIGGIGLLFALVTLVVGDLFDGVIDVEFGPDGVISTSTVAATMAGFGFGGAIAITVFGVESTGVAVLIATAVGLASWFVSFTVYRQLEKRTQPDGETSMAQLVGTTGVVMTAPYKVSALGEMSVTFQAQPLKINFLCDSKVTVGQEVTVTAVLSSSQVKVTPKDASA